MKERAIALLQDHRKVNPDKPFFMVCSSSFGFLRKGAESRSALAAPDLLISPRSSQTLRRLASLGPHVTVPRTHLPSHRSLAHPVTHRYHHQHDHLRPRPPPRQPLPLPPRPTHPQLQPSHINRKTVVDGGFTDAERGEGGDDG